MDRTNEERNSFNHLVSTNTDFKKWRKSSFLTRSVSPWSDPTLGVTLPFWSKLLNLKSYFKENERVLYRDRAKEMFYHGYNSYMNNAYPYDELDPIGLGSIILWPMKYNLWVL